jgi:pilus assembly protein FimV
LTRLSVSGRRVCVAFSLASAACSPVFALSLGAEQVTSSLGQPLRMAIPLLGSTTESLETRCFRVVSPIRSDGLSVITQARVELQTNVSPPLLIVRSNRSIDEPIVRISIEAGCDAPLRRDYTILLDPPQVRPELPASANALPAAVSTPEKSAAAPAAPAQSAATSPSAAKATESAAAKSGAPTARKNTARSADQPAKGNPVRQPRQKQSLAAQERKEIGPDRLQVQSSQQGSAATPIEDASLAALAVPRLRVSSDLIMIEPANQPPPAATDELQAAITKDRRARLLATPIEQDLAPRLEADLVVAQRRLAELQAQLSAAGIAANAASASPGKAAVPNPRATAAAAPIASAFNWRDWVWLPGLLLVAGLVAFLWRQRSAKRTEFVTGSPTALDQTTEEEITVVMPTQRPVASPAVNRSDDRAREAAPATGRATDIAAASPTITSAAAAAVAAVAPKPPPPAQPAPTRAEREASDRLNNPLFQLRDTESHVDVSELSQVTDEAQVYADLGRNDQAIELLRDHIDYQTGERSSPAPWLMIFDLYRRTNNRVGYDELAPQFRKHFNGRVPDWDNYGHELALDDGLEAFPHLVARIERDWGTAEARKFLEELLYDNRGGSRLGFSLAAYRDILLLLQVHEGLSAHPENAVAAAVAAADWESRGANDSDGTPKWDLSLEMIEPPKVGELESFLNRPPPDKS